MTPTQSAELLDRNCAQIMRVIAGGIDAASAVGLLAEWALLKEQLLAFHDRLTDRYNALKSAEN